MSADGGEETVEVTRADWEAMQARMARLEQAAGLREPAPVATSPTDRRTDRRGLLRHGAVLAAGAAAGAAVAVVGQAAPAEAANGSNLVLGSGSNVATAATGMEVNGTLVPYGLGVTDNGLGALPDGTSGAIFGHAKDQAWSVGVSGYAEAESVGVAGHSVGGIGVYGVSTGGTGVTGTTQASGASAVLGIGQGAASYGLVGSGGAAALRLAGGSAGPPPLRTDDHVSGEIDPDGNDGVWLCVVDGTPGSWVRLGAPGSAGAFSVLSASVRVYDSRSGQAPTSVGPKSPLVGGLARPLDMTAEREWGAGFGECGVDQPDGGAQDVVGVLGCVQGGDLLSGDLDVELVGGG